MVLVDPIIHQYISWTSVEREIITLASERCYIRNATDVYYDSIFVSLKAIPMQERSKRGALTVSRKIPLPKIGDCSYSG